MPEYFLVVCFNRNQRLFLNFSPEGKAILADVPSEAHHFENRDIGLLAAMVVSKNFNVINARCLPKNEALCAL